MYKQDVLGRVSGRLIRLTRRIMAHAAIAVMLLVLASACVDRNTSVAADDLTQPVGDTASSPQEDQTEVDDRSDDSLAQTPEVEDSPSDAAPTADAEADVGSMPVQETVVEGIQEAPKGYPDETTTGVPDGVKLTRSSSLSITEDGAVVTDLDVRGDITVNANNVTIRRSRVRTEGALYGIKVATNTKGTVIEDTEVEGTDDNCSVGVVYGRYTARRLNVHGCADGFRVGPDTMIRDSYVHDQRYKSGAHNDAVQSVGGSRLTIVGNNLEGPLREQTSAIIIQTNFARIDGVLIEDNLLSGGTYTLYLRDKKTGYGAPTNVTVRDNIWVDNSWKFGTHSVDRGQGMTWVNNETTAGQIVGSE
jgi:hypothetical protein